MSLLLVPGVARGRLVTKPPTGAVWKDYMGLTSAYTQLVHQSGLNEFALRGALEDVREQTDFLRVRDSDSFGHHRLVLSDNGLMQLHIHYSGPDILRNGDLRVPPRVFTSMNMSAEAVKPLLRPLIGKLYEHANLLRENASWRTNDS